ncbi:WecB/TagA/CpsF family glycosyltransferase [Herbiconiux sp. L3-i23]|uniref:WecB/TagA/CpsF family glycosyltransferase n=1 Tax=Herbiconiux sp. L3-i23 TaxID=2905871 RepID=UPI002065289D|nr:WecB/TagA/CpsF family glycosyltransferase [Herbiconiux sp. L3-i23]BDI21641.1 hypothetical protein L3i23_04170 [Herbiconiux sp. L3-i23]
MVAIGPFEVIDLPQREVIDLIASSEDPKPVAFALHVGGLNHRHDREFVQAMSSTPLVYADGAATVLLAKLGGARRIERAATTDIGIPTMVQRAKLLGRSARVAIVGGPPGLAERSGDALEAASHLLRVPYVTHGYHDDFTEVLAELRSVQPDIIVVGLGMPREAIWVEQHLAELPDSLIITCGGWLGFLAGDEQRAPKVMQNSGTEWVYRLAQSPGRLAKRYGSGLLTVAKMAVGQLRSRRAA